MKIHPLLYEVLREASGKTVGGMDTLSREFCRWQGAGCPVVEEEPTMSGLMQEAEQAETKERLRARIRELEALVSHQRGRIERMATAGVADDKRIRELEAQLPEQMKHCTIRYVECPVGHGRLTATNWVDDGGCQRCEIMELEAKLARRNSSLSELTVPGYEDQIRNAALEEAAKVAAAFAHNTDTPEWYATTMVAARIRALKKDGKNR